MFIIWDHTASVQKEAKTVTVTVTVTVTMTVTVTVLRRSWRVSGRRTCCWRSGGRRRSARATPWCTALPPAL
eukprot:853713-Pyramimonas_sp.AAC.1